LIHRASWLSALLLLNVLTSCKNERVPTTKHEPTQENMELTKAKLPDTTLLSPDYDTIMWQELLPSEFPLDLRYATKNNFTKVQIYPCARCFIRPQLAKKLLEIQSLELEPKGLNFKLFDCYRPRPAQQKLWDIVPDATYVANPSKGSMHNKGLAVDLTLVDSKGKELDMGTDFDYFGREARHAYTDLPEAVLANRRFLKTLMESNGFNSIKSEWWHYSLNGTGHQLSSWEWPCKD